MRLKAGDWDSRMNATTARHTVNLGDKTETATIFRTLLQTSARLGVCPFSLQKKELTGRMEQAIMRCFQYADCFC